MTNVCAPSATKQPWEVSICVQIKLRNMVLCYNRITHYPSLAQHPIPSSPFTRQPNDSSMFVYILIFQPKINPKTEIYTFPAQHCHDRAVRFLLEAEIPFGFKWLHGPSR